MKRFTKVAGMVVGAGAAVAAVVWMVRDRMVRPRPDAEAPQPPVFRVSPPEAPSRGDADDLAAIRGIGPVFKARLATAGIFRFEELADQSPDRLAEVAGVPQARAREWIDQARSLV